MIDINTSPFSLDPHPEDEVQSQAGESSSDPADAAASSQAAVPEANYLLKGHRGETEPPYEPASDDEHFLREEKAEHWAREVAATLNAGFQAQKMVYAEFRNVEIQVKSVLAEAESGNSYALSLLHHMAKLSTEALSHFPAIHEGIQQLAGREFYWPMLMPSHVKEKNDRRVDYLKELGLARKQPVDPERLVRTDTIPRAVVAYALGVIMEMRAPTFPKPPTKLAQNHELIARIGFQECDPWKCIPPDLNPFALPSLTLEKESFDMWFKAIKALVLQRTGGDPTSTRFPLLRDVGAHHATHGGAKPGTVTAEANIRQRFFEQLKKAFKQVVRG